MPPPPAQCSEVVGTMNVLPRVQSGHHEDGAGFWACGFSDLMETSEKIKYPLEGDVKGRKGDGAQRNRCRWSVSTPAQGGSGVGGGKGKEPVLPGVEVNLRP